MKHFLPHLLWIAGLGIIVLAVILFGHHGVPYPDPTPEQEAARKAGLTTFNLTALGGSLLFVIGILWAAFRSVQNRNRTQE